MVMKIDHSSQNGMKFQYVFAIFIYLFKRVITLFYHNFSPIFQYPLKLSIVTIYTPHTPNSAKLHAQYCLHLNWG